MQGTGPEGSEGLPAHTSKGASQLKLWFPGQRLGPGTSSGLSLTGSFHGGFHSRRMHQPCLLIQGSPSLEGRHIAEPRAGQPQGGAECACTSLLVALVLHCHQPDLDVGLPVCLGLGGLRPLEAGPFQCPPGCRGQRCVLPLVVLVLCTFTN